MHSLLIELFLSHSKILCVIIDVIESFGVLLIGRTLNNVLEIFRFRYYETTFPGLIQD